MERKLVGVWSYGCNKETCTFTILRADRTYSERFDDDPVVGYNGTWRVEGDQLVKHVTSAGPKAAQELVGQDVRVIISDYKEGGSQDSFVATSVSDKAVVQTWKRVSKRD